MERTAIAVRVLRFDVFEVDLEERELRRSGQRIKIQEQPFQILVLLLERPGAVLAREHLQKALWPNGTFVDFEHGLNTAVKKLREALGDSAEVPHFVETVARRGYRFIGEIDLPAANLSAATTPQRWLSRARIAFLVGLTVCAVALSFFFQKHSPTRKAAQPVVIPLVTDAGEKYTPSLSPDGRHLAFAWNGGSGPHFNLYVKGVGSEESLRLTNAPSTDFNPVWSPDGRSIAFGRLQKGATGIYIIPAVGGAERKVRKTFWDEQELYEVFWCLERLSWSTDGKSLAFSDHPSLSERASSIFLLSLDSLEVRRLTSPQFSSSDFSPKLSPDGQTLAFLRASPENQSIYTVSVSGGDERRVVPDIAYNWGLAWAADSRAIVFAKAGWIGDAGWLWKISLNGDEPQRLQFSEEGVEPSIQGNRLVYVRQKSNLNIWRRKLNSLSSASPPDRFISSRMDSSPQFSVDGSRIAFESTRSGTYEVWICRSDGSGLTQLTHLDCSAGTPRWSPDGQQIAFDSLAPGNSDIFVMNSQGGSIRRLTTEPSSDNVPSWSRDGHWIYFASDRTGGFEVWKIPSAGGPSVQVTHHGGFAAFESTDGKFLYYAKGRTAPGVWRVPTNGGDEIEVIGALEAGYWGSWALVENGIYYLDMTRKPGIAFFNTTSHQTTPVFDLQNRPVLEGPGLAVSPNMATVLYTERDVANSDVVVVDNY